MGKLGDRRPDGSADSFGDWLRRRRKALDLTQEVLARAVSCSRHAIRKIEADERRPSVRLAARLADKLGVPPDEREVFLAAARGVRGADRLVASHVAFAPPGGADDHDPLGDPFVGRSREQETLRRLLDRLTARRGHVALIQGEAGIGKSRLMAELARDAHSRELPVLETRCYEIEQAIAYQPVIDLVTQAAAIAPRVLATLSPVSLAEIAALVPAVAAQVETPASSPRFPEARQARLHGTLTGLFEAFAAERPLVVIVDDLQWADDASATFLHYFARRAARSALVVLLAFREEDLAVNARLADFVASASREPQTSRIALGPLGVEDVEVWIRKLFARDASSTTQRDGSSARGCDHAQPLESGDIDLAQLAARLHRETDGNAFFLSSMLHALAAGEVAPTAGGGLPVPAALTAAVRARLNHVPADARDALDVAAVLGRRFDFETLLDVTKADEESLSRSVEMLVQRRLLREEEDGGYDFAHEKVREVTYFEIGSARRMLLHRAVAESLARELGPGARERRSDDSGERHGRLAEHYERGHVWHDALEQMVRAAAHAQRVFALRDALQWLDRAIALATTYADALRHRTLEDLYERRGTIRAQSGQISGAVDDIRRVVEAARERGDALRECDALIQLGMTYRRADDYGNAVACLTEALDASRAARDECRAADTLYHLGTVAWSDGRNAEAIGHHAEAVAICERLGLADVVAVQAYHGRGEAHFADLDPRAAICCYERSIELARVICEKSYESENLMMIGFASDGIMGLGDYAAAERHFTAALEIAEHADLEWHRGPILLGRDHVRACLGRYAEAFASMTATLAYLESLAQLRYALMAYHFLAELLLDVGLNADAAHYSERALALGRDARIAFWRPRIAASLALARIRQGVLDAAMDVERDAEQCRAQREGWQLTRCLEALTELALARGDADASLRHASELLALAESGGLSELAGVAHRLRGEALAVLGNRSAALAEIEAAAKLAQRSGRVRHIYDAEAARAKLGEPSEAERWAKDISDGAAAVGALLAAAEPRRS